MVSPRDRRRAVERLVTERGLSQRHACQLVGMQRSTARYVRHARSEEADTVALIREYAHEQPMYGYRIISAMLKHDGYRINRKRVYRICRQEGLQLPRRKPMKRRYGDSTGTLRQASIPVQWIPAPIHVTPSADALRTTLGLPEKRRVFLINFNATSSYARKNPEAIIKAFRRAFCTASASSY